MSGLDRLEHMLALSQEMADAAGRNEWEKLEVLERQLANERDRLRTDEPGGEQSGEGLSDEQLLRKAELITRILANTDEVRTHVDPFLDSTRKLLSGAVRDNNVRRAYGAFGP